VSLTHQEGNELPEEFRPAQVRPILAKGRGAAQKVFFGRFFPSHLVGQLQQIKGLLGANGFFSGGKESMQETLEGKAHTLRKLLQRRFVNPH